MSDKPKRRFTVTVEGTDDPTPLINRFAMWLKSGLRRFGLRCVDAREIEEKVPVKETSLPEV